MKHSQKVPNSQWIAHDELTTDVLPKTLRSSLMESKLAYIEENMTSFDPASFNFEWDKQDFVDAYQDQIPDTIRFVIVTLEPRWDTQVS